jgi:ferredoxin
MPERAYGGLLMEIHNALDSRKMLVITCDKQRIPRRPWMVIEQVPGIAVMGLRQLAMAASSSVAAMVVYCPDGKCVGKEHVQRAVNSIATLSRSTRAPIHYLEGVEGLEEIERIYDSTQGRNMPLELAADPWKTYTHALVSLSDNHSQADALGLTDMRVDESCTLCNACVDKCPHGALAIQEGNLVFESQNCTGCGYCERICPEHSITLSEMRGPTTMRPRPVYSGEMTRCVKCGNPYASARMIEKVSTILHDDGVLRLCPECRQRETYENLFGGSYKPV